MADASASSDGGWVHIKLLLLFLCLLSCVCCSFHMFIIITFLQCLLCSLVVFHDMCYVMFEHVYVATSSRLVRPVCRYIMLGLVLRWFLLNTSPSSLDGSRLCGDPTIYGWFKLPARTRTHACIQTQQFKRLRLSRLPARRGSSAEAVGALRAACG